MQRDCAILIFSLVGKPPVLVLLPYSSDPSRKQLRKLDCQVLDTTSVADISDRALTLFTAYTRHFHVLCLVSTPGPAMIQLEFMFMLVFGAVCER